MVPRSLVAVGLALGLGAAGLAQSREESPKGPRHSRSTETASPAALPPPPLRPPPGIEGLPGAPLAEARGHLATADVWEGVGRRAAHLLEGLGEAPDCGAFASHLLAYRLSLEEAATRLRSAEALLASVERVPAEIEAQRSALSGSLALLADEPSRRARRVQRRCPALLAEAMPAAGEASVSPGEAVGVFVRGDRPGDVVWLDDEPAGIVGVSGWGLLVTSAGRHRLCVTDPRDASCPAGISVEARAGRAATDVALGPQ